MPAPLAATGGGPAPPQIWGSASRHALLTGMPGRLPPPIGLALLAAVTAGTAAFAQDAPAPAPTPAAAAPACPRLGGSAGARSRRQAARPAASRRRPQVPRRPRARRLDGPPRRGRVMGYGYGASHSAPSAALSDGAPHRRHLLAHHANEAVATFTGFEMLADGGSRLFVQLSKQVDVEQERAEARSVAPSGKAKKGHPRASAGVVSRLEFVLKGAEVVNPMNEGALVTVHFNTPVVRARIVPAGKNLDLMVELRADVTPQMKVVPAKDNGSMLQIDFPQGSYLPAGAEEPAAATSGTAAGTMPGALRNDPGKSPREPRLVRTIRRGRSSGHPRVAVAVALVAFVGARRRARGRPPRRGPWTSTRATSRSTRGRARRCSRGTCGSMRPRFTCGATSCACGGRRAGRSRWTGAVG